MANGDSASIPINCDPWYAQMDETLAIAGVVAVAIIAIFLMRNEAGMQIVNTAVGGLIGYIGRGRIQSK